MNKKHLQNKNTDVNRNVHRKAAWQRPLQLLMLALLNLCWLSIGLFYLILEPKEYSTAERRRLAAAPALTFSSITNGSYLTAVENYVKDQFPAREFFRNIKTASSLYGFLRLQDNGYAIKEGHLCRMDMELNETSVSYACAHIQYLYDTYLADSGCRVYYCVIPDKNNYLQLSPTPDYVTMETQIGGALDFAIPIDIKNDLSLSSFYLTDTHWKQDCLLPAAQTILSAMLTEDNYIFPSEEYLHETALEQFQGVLCGNMGWYLLSEPMQYLTNERIRSASVSHLEHADCDTVYDPRYLTYDGPGADPYSFFLSGPSAFVTIRNAAADRHSTSRQSRELVVFRDSFGSAIAPLFLTGYDQITLIDTRYIHPALLGDYIDFSGQDVLFLYSTLLMNNSWSLKSP